MKNLIKGGSMLVAVIFTVILLFGYFARKTNERHTVHFFQGSSYTYYENSGEVAKVDVSPAIVSKNRTGRDIAAGIMLIVLWIAVWYVSTDRYLGNKSIHVAGGSDVKPGKAIGIVALPLVLCVVLFFGGYSEKFANNYKEISKDRFDKWLQSGAIEKKGERTYVGDSLKALFKNMKLKK